jgi:hypothetical protein
LRAQLEELNQQSQAETEKLQTALSPDALALERVQIAPKKTDIAVGEVVLAWQPWIVRMDGAVEPGT